MAGYTRQSVADIINGSDITAPPLNAEFNQIQTAFGTGGHSHDGTAGNAPKIVLTTSVSGYLPADHGGVGGKNKLDATSAPTTSNDASEGYAPGSIWENTSNGRVYICVGNTNNAAVWRELVTVITDNKIEPVTTDTIDLGTPTVRFQDLFLSGGISASGNASIGGTLSITGATSLSSTLAVTGTSTLTGDVTASGALTVAGATTLNGTVDIGNSALDTLTVSAVIDSDLLPTGSQDLGSSSAEWTNLYIDGIAQIDTLTVDENATVAGTLSVTGDTTVANLSATGTTTITSGDINSGAMDNTTIGAATPAAGTFTTLAANTSLTAATADINGGTIDGASVGATTPSTGAFTSLSASGTSTLSTVDINAGAIDGTTIGASSHTTGKFTTLQSTGQATLDSVNIDGGAIDGTTIGATTTSSGAFTTLSASGGITGDITGGVTGNVTGNVTGDLTGDVTGDLTGNVTSSGSSSFNNVTIDGTLNMNAGTTATITNLTSPTNTNDAATKGYVDTQVANLVDSAPGTLDTLNELAAALDDDPNFSTTITNSIATKLPLAGGTMTGAIAMGTSKITGLGDPTAAQDAATKNYADTQDALQVTKTGDSMSGNLAMGSNNITGLATPTANDHATNKSYVDGILGSATAASASAAAAATSESNAATSETNAASSASAAAADRATVASLYDSFDDRYLGPKSSAPTQDNDGNALVVGALYFNSTNNIMYVYGSGGWQAAGSSVNGTSDRQTYTATAGQTVFAATYDAGYVDVYLNGVKLLAGTDFTATNGTSITLASGAAVNDIMDIVAYGTFVLADHYTGTQSDARYVNVTGDTMTGNLDVGGTVTADGLTVDGATGEFRGSGANTTYFTGGDDSIAGRQLTLSSEANGGQNNAIHRLTVPSGYGSFNVSVNSAERLKINNNGDITFYDTDGSTASFVYDASAGLTINEQGADRDFRVESDSNTHALFVDAGDDVVNINSSSGAFNAATKLQVAGRLRVGTGIGSESSGMTTPTQPTMILTKESNTPSSGEDRIYALAAQNSGYAVSGNTPPMSILLGGWQNGSSRSGGIEFDPSDQGLYVLAGGSQVGYSSTNRIAKFTPSSIVFNEDSEDMDFRVESDLDTHMLFVDASTNRVGINRSSPDAPLHLQAGSSGGSLSDAFQISDSSYVNIAMYSGGADGEIRIGAAGSLRGSYKAQYAGTRSAHDFHIGTNSTNMLSFDGGGSVVVVNEAGADRDFRVEGDSNANMFVVDASNDTIGIGTQPNNNNLSPAMHFVNGGTLFGYGDAMYITGNTYYNNNWKAIATGGGANAVIDSLGFKVYNNASASANATISPLLHLTVGPSEMVINDDSYDYDFRVESDSNTNMLYVDGSSSGAVHIGTNINVFGAADAYGMNLFDGGIANFSSNDASIHYWNIENLSTTRAVVTFYATRSSVGNISISTSGTTYNTTSDRRLKDNIEPIADGTEKLMEMNPVTHTWKADPNTGETVHGFIAQEMMNVVPEAVSGDPNGEEMMSMDYGRITPVLVAALQDAVKEITALKERVAELEAK